MLTILTERECRDAFRGSVSDGIAAGSGNRVDIDQEVFDEFLELLTFEWIELIETTPFGNSDADDLLACFDRMSVERPDDAKLPRKRARTIDLPFPGSFELPLAARGLPATYLGYRQVRVQEYLFNFALDTINGMFANPESIPLKLLAGGQAAITSAALLIDPSVSVAALAASLVISAIRTNYRKPRLDASERCLYVKMWYHDLAGGYSVEAMQTWFATRCDIPARRYWRCAYRVEKKSCEIDVSVVSELAESLCDKGFFQGKAFDARDGREAKLYTLKLR